MSVCTVYITASSREEALVIGRQLVEERLAACANVIAGVISVYQWEGRVQQEAEAVLLLKTRQSLAERLAARVQELHSYDCPAVVVWPIVGGSPDYLAWIAAETAP